MPPFSSDVSFYSEPQETAGEGTVRADTSRKSTLVPSQKLLKGLKVGTEASLAVISH